MKHVLVALLIAALPWSVVRAADSVAVATVQ